jgi:hypothetical protein
MVVLADNTWDSRLLGGATQVTGVGIHTEWGQVMASISEDTGEETPLQVLFLLVGLPSDALAIPNFRCL